MPNHFTLTFFCCEGAMYHVAIATVLFSHVKISCFRAKAHLVFHWYLYNNIDYFVKALRKGLHFAPLKIIKYLFTESSDSMETFII